MLGKRSPQTKLFATSTLLDSKQLKEMGVYGRMAREGRRIFKDEDFSSLYCENNGRPSAPPSILAMATVLQFIEGISDARVIDRCRFDLRWKAALHIETHDLRAPFAKSTFQAFRSRLVVHDAEGQIFEASVRVAQEAGLLPKKVRLSLDSSPVRGRGAVKDTYNLLSDAIKKVLQRIATEQDRSVASVATESGLERHVIASSIKGSMDLNWSNAEERQRVLGELLKDCNVVVELAKQAGCAEEDVKLLEQVIRQDVDVNPDDEPPTIRRGVAKDRMPSVIDPEMRHGHKSSGKGYTGHKAHVAVTETGVITDVDVTAPSVPEGSKVSDAITASREITGSGIDEVLGDCAYSSRRAQGQAGQSGVTLHSKMPGHRRGCFEPGDFTVSEDGTEARCPAGQTSASRQKLRDGHVLFWSAETCASCAMRSSCTKAPRRSLAIPPDFHERRARERFAQSPEGREIIRGRVVVEHAIGRMKQRGAGRARYLGRRKTRLQWALTAAAVNLSLAWSASEAKAAA